MSLAAKGRMDSLSGGPDRPVIFLSGYGRDETIAKALELGATDYVVKPFSPTELVARIQAALRKQAGPTEPFRSVFGHDGLVPLLLLEHRQDREKIEKIYSSRTFPFGSVVIKRGGQNNEETNNQRVQTFVPRRRRRT